MGSEELERPNEDAGMGGDEDAEDMLSSAARYENRRKMRKSISRGDLWIAFGLYLVLSGVAFVIL